MEFVFLYDVVMTMYIMWCDGGIYIWCDVSVIWQVEFKVVGGGVFGVWD